MLRIFAGLIAISGAVQESAQAQPAPPPTKVWNLEWQDSHCTISTGTAKTLGLSLWMTPGDPDPDLYLVGSSVPANVGKSVTVAVVPTGETFRAEVDDRAAGNARILKLVKLKHKF